MYENGYVLDEVPNSAALTAATVSGLTCNTAYTFSLTAHNGLVESDHSNTVNVTTRSCVTTANDDFNNAIQIANYPYEQNGWDTSWATQAADDPAIPVCGLQPGANTVWYRYTPSFSGEVYIDTFGSDYDTYVAVFTGSRGALNAIACNDDKPSESNAYRLQSQVEMPLVGGTTYYIQVGKFNGFIQEASVAEVKEVPEMEAQSGGNLNFHITSFQDIAGDYWSWKWTEGFYRQGITTGCAANPRHVLS